ncbi:MAG TPA: hypothetical protein PLA37_14015, partial [Anaerolineaceae bacterium]|nr:hypothetical protein [Anaerolineaceae bacterium]
VYARRGQGQPMHRPAPTRYSEPRRLTSIPSAGWDKPDSCRRPNPLSILVFLLPFIEKNINSCELNRCIIYFSITVHN